MDTWSVVSSSWYIMSRACWRKRTNMWSIIGRLKICSVILFGPNISILLWCFQGVTRVSFPKFLISWSLFRFVYIMSLVKASLPAAILMALKALSHSMINFGKSNIWLLRKIFQSQVYIFIQAIHGWIIHQDGLNHPRFSCSLRFWGKWKRKWEGKTR